MENKYLPVLFWVLIQVHVARGDCQGCMNSTQASNTSCSDVLAFPNSCISFVSNTTGLFAIAECNYGYSAYGSTEGQCIDGEWIGLDYYCITNDGCGTFPRILNGKVTINQDCDCLTATITCDDGFYPTGPTEAICFDGEWYNGTSTICQSNAHAGKHFAVVFMRSTSKINGNVQKDLIITTENTANVNVTSAFLGTSFSTTITGHGVLPFDPQFTLQQNGILNKAIIVESDVDINVQVLSFRVKGGQVAMDSYYALPINFYGNNEYFLIGAENTDMFAVIALDDIDVYIFNPDSSSMVNVSLNLYEVYHRFNSNYTGVRVQCSGNCAVVGGFYFGLLPIVESSASRDAGIVEYVPTSDYYTLCLAGPPYPDLIYILKPLARYDNTTVTFCSNGNYLDVSLDRGDYYEYLSDGYPTVVMSDKPILVGQFSVTTKLTHRPNSDPSLLLCLSPDQYGNNYKFRTAAHLDAYCFLRCIIRSSYKNDLLLNGGILTELISYTLQVPCGDEYSVVYAIIERDTVYTLSSSTGEPFSADYYCHRRVGQITTRIGRLIKSAA